MKVFLTGERQVGKSTAIGIFTKRLGFQPGGFRTLIRQRNTSDIEDLCLIPYARGVHKERPAEPVATRIMPGSPVAGGDHNVPPVSAEGEPAYRQQNGIRQPKTGLQDEKSRIGYWDVDSGAFNRIGQKFLRESAGARLIIMDELGFLERDAAEMQAAVLEILSEEVDVLGVVKPMDIPFLNKVRAAADHILEVNLENRDRIPALLEALFDLPPVGGEDRYR